MLLQGSYEGASFFDLLQHDFPHLLPFQHLPQLPAEGLPSSADETFIYANDSFVSFSNKARQICLHVQDTPLTPIGAELP